MEFKHSSDYHVSQLRPILIIASHGHEMGFESSSPFRDGDQGLDSLSQAKAKFCIAQSKVRKLGSRNPAMKKMIIKTARLSKSSLL
jgi:hypothetical protein